MVDEGSLAKLIKEPAFAINFAARSSPTKIVRFGAIAFILVAKYSARVALYSEISTTYWANDLMFISSSSRISDPIETSEAFLMSFSISSDEFF